MPAPTFFVKTCWEGHTEKNSETTANFAFSKCSRRWNTMCGKENYKKGEMCTVITNKHWRQAQGGQEKNHNIPDNLIHHLASPSFTRPLPKSKSTTLGICVGDAAKELVTVMVCKISNKPPQRYFILIPGIYKCDETSLIRVNVWYSRRSWT